MISCSQVTARVITILAVAPSIPMPVKYFVLFLGFWAVCLVVALLGASTEAGLFAQSFKLRYYLD